MNLTTLITLVGCAAAGVFAWSVGGALATGVVTGFLLGATVSGLCILRLKMAVKKNPDAILRVALEGFLVKMAFLTIGGVAFGFIAPLGEMVDVRGFLIAFVTGAVLVLIPGSLEAVREASARRSQVVSGTAKS